MNFNHIVAYTIPKGAKDQNIKDDCYFTPKITQYEPKGSFQRAPAWKIGTSNRPPVGKSSKLPEPGKYEHKTLFGTEGPKYSFRKKLPENDMDPTKRNPKAVRDKTPPGIGSYTTFEHPHGPFYSFRPKITIVKSKKKKDRGAEVGDYELRNDALLFGCEANKFSTLTRDHSTKKLDKDKAQLGPGKYDINDKLSTHSSTFSISKTPRFDYQIKVRNKSYEADKASGPGRYAIKEYFGKEGPKYSFQNEPKFHVYKQEENKNPGPTRYFNSIAYVPDSAHQYTFPRLERRDYSVNKVMLTFPDLNKYNPEKKFLSTWTTFPSWVITKSNEEELACTRATLKSESEMGPGKYTYSNLKNIQTSSPEYTMRARVKGLEGKDRPPSPTRYNPSMALRPTEPSYTFTQTSKENAVTKEAKKENKPGVGSYDVKDSYSSKSYTFPKSKRYTITGKNSLKKPDDDPGPGFYPIPCRFNDISDETRKLGVWNPRYKFV